MLPSIFQHNAQCTAANVLRINQEIWMLYSTFSQVIKKKHIFMDFSAANLLLIKDVF